VGNVQLTSSSSAAGVGGGGNSALTGSRDHDRQAEILDLRLQLDNAKSIIKEQAMCLNRLEEENARLRHYMDELTRYQDMAKRYQNEDVRGLSMARTLQVSGCNFLPA